MINQTLLLFQTHLREWILSKLLVLNMMINQTLFLFQTHLREWILRKLSVLNIMINRISYFKRGDFKKTLSTKHND